MSRILAIASIKSKPTRRTVRPSAPFGSGILPDRPDRRPRFEPSEADRQWAAQVFGDTADWGARLIAGFESCEVCDRPVRRGELIGGLGTTCESGPKTPRWRRSTTRPVSASGRSDIRTGRRSTCWTTEGESARP